jgi:hypothetical protein
MLKFFYKKSPTTTTQRNKGFPLFFIFYFLFSKKEKKQRIMVGEQCLFFNEFSPFFKLRKFSKKILALNSTFFSIF